MAKLPRATGKAMVRFPEREGFRLVRVTGSHHYLARDDLRTSVPVHGNRPLKLGTLRSILRAVEISPEEFENRFRG